MVFRQFFFQPLYTEQGFPYQSRWFCLCSFLPMYTSHWKLMHHIIRIYQKCEGQIEESVPKIIFWHYEAYQLMTNDDLEGQIFSISPNTNDRFFFWLTIQFSIFKIIFMAFIHSFIFNKQNSSHIYTNSEKMNASFISYIYTANEKLMHLSKQSSYRLGPSLKGLVTNGITILFCQAIF